MSARTVCLTFDVDLVDHAGGGEPVDEFAVAMPAITQVFDRHPHWVATWFIRLDDHIAACLGSATALFDQHAPFLRTLSDAGHELAWHPHAYARSVGGAWRQNTDDRSISEELSRLAPAARSHGLKVVRMGWGFHTNTTMRAIADAGFRIDSSAIPRPTYEWDLSVKDWRPTPLHPYRPSVRDYRVPGQPEIGLLEVPMSVGLIPAPYDTQPVLRYINPAFHDAAVVPVLETWFSRFNHLVTVTHPYEMVGGGGAHPLIAHDPVTFERNVETIERLAERDARPLSFQTLSGFSAGATPVRVPS